MGLADAARSEITALQICRRGRQKLADEACVGTDFGYTTCEILLGFV